MREINILLYEQLAGLILLERNSSQHKLVSPADWNFTHRERTLARRQLRMYLVSAIFNRNLWQKNNSIQSVTMPMPQFHP